MVQFLAPEVVLREDIGLLRRMLGDLQDAKVVDWHKGGQVSGDVATRISFNIELTMKLSPLQVLLHYADLCERARDLVKPSASAEQDDQLDEIIRRIPTLLEALEKIYPGGSSAAQGEMDMQIRVCRVHMIAKVQKVATALASQRRVSIGRHKFWGLLHRTL